MADPCKGIVANRCFLCPVSPQEPAHALVLKIAAEISAGKSDAVLKLWIRMWLSTPVEFRVLDVNQKRYASASALRERIGAEFEALYYTSVQRIYQIYAFGKYYETDTGRKGTHDEVSASFNLTVKVSSGEAVTPAMSAPC